jgi:hypothetical protein
MKILFLSQLDENKVYALLSILSKNSRPDEPYIILSQTILVTNNSKSLILIKCFENTNDTLNLYDIKTIEKMSLIFKYKEVKIEFNKHSSF